MPEQDKTKAKATATEPLAKVEDPKGPKSEGSVPEAVEPEAEEVAGGKDEQTEDTSDEDMLGLIMEAIDGGFADLMAAITTMTQHTTEVVLPLLEQAAHPQQVLAPESMEQLAEMIAERTGQPVQAGATSIDIIPSDLSVGEQVRVSHIGFDSPYTGHTGRVAFVPPDGDWPFVVAFHAEGTFPGEGDRFPTSFHRNELAKTALQRDPRSAGRA
jgi:hypothetical protein